LNIKRLVVVVFLRLACMPLIFFLPAGTLIWPEAWFMLFILLVMVVTNFVWLLKNDLELLRERLSMSFHKDQKKWDKFIVFFMFVFSLALLILPGFDAVRYGWSFVPVELEILGFLVFLLSAFLVSKVLRANRFLSPMVKIQRSKGHCVIQKGPYLTVRHPMYIALILMYISFPLSLGSVGALLLSPVLIILITIRTYLEDKTLHQELPGYTEYAQTVRYRLIPYLW